MENGINSPRPAQGRHLRMPGHQYPVPEQPLGGIQNGTDQGLSIKICQQLVPSEAPSQARSHDDAAQGPKGVVQVHQKHIRAIAQRRQKRQLLLPHHGADLFLFQKGFNGLLIGAALGFQIADFVQGDPGGRGAGAALQGRDAEGQKGLFQQHHLIPWPGEPPVKNRCLNLFPGAVVPQKNRLSGHGPAGKPRGPGGKQGLQQGGLAAAPGAGQNQVPPAAPFKGPPDALCRQYVLRHKLPPFGVFSPIYPAIITNPLPKINWRCYTVIRRSMLFI